MLPLLAIPGVPRAAALAAGCALSLLFASPEARAQAWVREYEQGVKSDSSDDRRKALEVIDLENERVAADLLLRAIANDNKAQVDWFQRKVAIERLAELDDEKTLKQIDQLLKKVVRPRTREVHVIVSLLDACSRQGDARFHASFEAALEKKAQHPPEVRRAAIRALGRTGKVQYVPTILAEWEQEPLDVRNVLACRAALEAITEREHGRDLARWKAFWDQEGKGYKKPSEGGTQPESGTEAKETTEEKKRETTVTREMPLSFTTTGREGAEALLVIHDSTWSTEYFEPYLSSLGDIYKIHYVELPKISTLVEVYKDKPDKIKRNIGGFPFYPYDALCDAFDEARKEMGHQKFAILAHGFSTMVAQRYLAKYGDNVTHAILVGTFPGDDAYGNVLEKLRAKAIGTKEKEIVRAVDFHYITDEKTFKRFYDPKDDRELEALERKWFTMMFANPQDTEIGEIWERARTPENMSLAVVEREQSQSPPFDVSRERRPPVPMLVVSGKKAIWFGEQDGERVARNYPRARHVVLAEAANMPWFDDPKGFEKAVRDFHAEVTAPSGRR